MMTRAQRLAFLKVLAAVAWADGAVQERERNRIKTLFNGFNLDPADRKEVEVLLERPVSFARALELAKEFAGGLAGPGARRRLLEEIEAMLGREREPGETELLEHVRSILTSHTVVDHLVEKMRGLFARSLFRAGGRRRSSGALTEHARNAALRRVRERLAERGESLEENLAEWNRVTLLGVLLAHVARVEEGWQSGERRALERALAERLRLREEEREVLLAVMEDEAERDTDLQRICAEYCRVSTMEERLGVVRALFEVAVADGRIGKRELELIRRIADFLWISNREYLCVRDRYRNRIAS